MKVKVIEQFLDKFTREPYMVGTVLDFEDSGRVKDLVDRKLVKVLDEPEKAKKGARNARKGKACSADLA